MDFTFVLQKGYVYARVEYFDPMIGTEFIEYIESPQVYQEVDCRMNEIGFYYESYIEDRTKPHYIIEYLMGRDTDIKNRKTIKRTRYYEKEPTSTAHI
jgi:hypothetical protein